MQTLEEKMRGNRLSACVVSLLLASVGAQGAGKTLKSGQILQLDVEDTLKVGGTVTLSQGLAAGSIASDAVTTAKILAGSVTTAKLLGGGDLTTSGEPVCVSGNGFGSCSDAVTTGMLQGASVTTPKINSDAITAAKIITGAVSTSKIASYSVTTIKMYIDAAPSKVMCVTSNKVPGVCSDLPDATGGCTCSSGL